MRPLDPLSSSSVNASAFGPLRYSRTVYGTNSIALQLLGQHQRIAVGVVEGCQPHHVLDLARLAVEAHALALEVGAGGVDVVDGEGERGAAALPTDSDWPIPTSSPRTGDWNWAQRHSGSSNTTFSRARRGTRRESA